MHLYSGILPESDPAQVFEYLTVICAIALEHLTKKLLLIYVLTIFLSPFPK